MERVTSADGRRGWLTDSRIPDVHVFTLSGRDDDMFMKNEDEYKKT